MPSKSAKRQTTKIWRTLFVHQDRLFFAKDVGWATARIREIVGSKVSCITLGNAKVFSFRATDAKIELLKAWLIEHAWDLTASSGDKFDLRREGRDDKRYMSSVYRDGSWSGEKEVFK